MRSTPTCPILPGRYRRHYLLHCGLLALMCGLLPGLETPVRARPRQLPTTFVRLSTGQGLSQSTAQCLAQDAQGFIWVGTQDGLNRYDGYTFRVFRTDPSQPSSLSDNYITALCADRSGLWVGTQHGLNRYDPARETFTRFQPRAGDEAGLAHDRITALHCDARGVLWIGTPRGLHRLEGERLVRLASPPPPRNRRTASASSALSPMTQRESSGSARTAGCGVSTRTPGHPPWCSVISLSWRCISTVRGGSGWLARD
ncbi:hypothetical protein J8C07_11815 [Chloracidobacterium sp. S]|nr:two-component regulator propeller domain-containing protein [Chloracidobacterium aggregatum]QUV89373.1 hypothetical protein J8C07_11815 [Chloracidobacterium sp. S]